MRVHLVLGSCFLLSIPSLLATTAQWISSETGSQNSSWQNTANWNPTTPPGGAAGDEADFTSTSTSIPASPTVTNGGTVALGTMKIDSNSNYTIQTTSSFSFHATSATAAISVTNTNGNGVQTIQGPILLSSPLNITNNATSTLTLSGGPISGIGPLTLNGSGTVVFGGNNSYSLGTVLSGGTLSVSADNNLGQSGTQVTIGTATFLASSTFSTNRPFSLTADASIDVANSETLTLSGQISGAGSLSKIDGGILVLSNTSNNYQGGTNVNAGTLSVFSDSNLGNTIGALNLGSGTLFVNGNFSTNRTGSLTGAAIIDSNGFTVTLNKAFTGAGSLTITGGGNVTLLGANSYTGGNFINADTTLIGTTSSIPGSVTFNETPSALLFNQTDDGSFTGELLSAMPGIGIVYKQASATITLTQNSPSFSGLFNIQQGALVINGAIANSTVQIANGALLGGAGTVGDTTNSGQIFPGDGQTPVTLHINGDLTLNANSTVLITGLPQIADKIAVTGTAALDGALVFSPLPAFYGFSADYTILTSSNRMMSFSSVTSTNPNFAPSVSYVGNDVHLHVVIPSPFASFPFSNINTKAVGNNIGAIYKAGELSSSLLDSLSILIGESNSDVNQALNQMHPAPYTAFVEVQAESGSEMLSLFRRLPYLQCNCTSPNRFWLEPFGNALHVRHTSLETGFQANTAGIGFGYDGAVHDQLVLGIGGAWNYTHLRWQKGLGENKMNGFYGALYFDSQCDAFYLHGAFLAGADLYESKRHIHYLSVNEHPQARYLALDLMAQASTAYLFGSPQAFFYPYLNCDFFYLSTRPYKEKHGAGFNLHIRKHTEETLRTELGIGLQVQDRNMAETVCLSPQINLGWTHIWPVKAPLIRSTFEGASIPFYVRGWNKNWNLLHARFGLQFSYYCFRLALQYNVEIDPGTQTRLYNQHANLEFQWGW